jgi:steroid delta-isomerase
MPEIPDTIQAYAKAFTAGDREGWLDLFSPTATMEDPVGTPVKRGREEIGAFWDQSRALAPDGIELQIAGDPLVCGREAAFELSIVVSAAGSRMAMPAIDVMTFDDNGRIATQRAFVDFSKLAPLPDA